MGGGGGGGCTHVIQLRYRNASVVSPLLQLKCSSYNVQTTTFVLCTAHFDCRKKWAISGCITWGGERRGGEGSTSVFCVCEYFGMPRHSHVGTAVGAKGLKV